MENFSPIFVDDSECDDRSNDQYVMTGQKKQSHNCGLSGRASGCPLFIHPISLSHVINPYTATPLRTIILPLFNI